MPIFIADRDWVSTQTTRDCDLTKAKPVQVIGEIIRYLNRRGRLTPEDIAYLEAEGFYTLTEDECEQAWNERWEDARNEALLYPEENMRRTVETARTPIRRKRVQPPQDALTAIKICKQIDDLRPVWANAISPIVLLASCLDSSASLDTAPTVLRKAGPSALVNAIAAEMQVKPEWFVSLWPALKFQGFRACGGDGSVAGNAYRAIMTGRDTHEIGKYAWILRSPQIAWVYGLVASQREILRACGVLYDTHFPQLDAHLTRTYRSNAFWPYLLLHSACRYQCDYTLNPSAYERRLPKEALLEPKAFAEEWDLALEMRRSLVLPYMLFATRNSGDAPDKYYIRARYGSLPFVCPSNWYKPY